MSPLSLWLKRSGPPARFCFYYFKDKSFDLQQWRYQIIIIIVWHIVNDKISFGLNEIILGIKTKSNKDS